MVKEDHWYWKHKSVEILLLDEIWKQIFERIKSVKNEKFLLQKCKGYFSIWADL